MSALVPSSAPGTRAIPRHRPTYGAMSLPTVTIDSYSLELEDAGGLVGDQASQTAFRELLEAWRERLEKAGKDPLGTTPTEALSKKELDQMAKGGNTEAQRTIALAVAEFAGHLAYVIRRFRQHPAWRDVERIVVGGGFKESEIGRLVIRLATQRLADDGAP